MSDREDTELQNEEKVKPYCKNIRDGRAKLQREAQKKIDNMLSQPLSLEQLRGSVPRTFRGHITEKFVEDLEESLKNEEYSKQIKENFISYSQVLNDCDPNVNIWDYVNAVKFISFKVMGYSVDESYAKTFPDKIEKLIKEGKKTYINKYANGYNKSKIVNKIYQQTLIPSYILNAPLFQEALNTLADMVRSDAVKGMAKVKACEAILNYTKPPEVAKAEINVKLQQNDAIAELREAAQAFAKTMKMAIEEGKSSIEDVIDAEVVKVEEG